MRPEQIALVCYESVVALELASGMPAGKPLRRWHDLSQGQRDLLAEGVRAVEEPFCIALGQFGSFSPEVADERHNLIAGILGALMPEGKGNALPIRAPERRIIAALMQDVTTDTNAEGRSAEFVADRGTDYGRVSIVTEVTESGLVRGYRVRWTAPDAAPDGYFAPLRAPDGSIVNPPDGGTLPNPDLQPQPIKPREVPGTREDIAADPVLSELISFSDGEAAPPLIHARTRPGDYLCLCDSRHRLAGRESLADEDTDANCPEGSKITGRGPAPGEFPPDAVGRIFHENGRARVHVGDRVMLPAEARAAGFVPRHAGEWAPDYVQASMVTIRCHFARGHAQRFDAADLRSLVDEFLSDRGVSFSGDQLEVALSNWDDRDSATWSAAKQEARAQYDRDLIELAEPAGTPEDVQESLPAMWWQAKPGAYRPEGIREQRYGLAARPLDDEVRLPSRQWAPGAVLKAGHPKVLDPVHYVSHAGACRAAIVADTLETANAARADGELPVRGLDDTVRLAIFGQDGCTSGWAEHDNGTYAAGERTFTQGEPLPPITCADLTFRPCTWHYAP